MKRPMIPLMAAAALIAGCECLFPDKVTVPETPRVAALDAKAWSACEWISFAGAKVAGGDEYWQHQRAADGTAYFMRKSVNAKKVAKAVWMTSGLGVYEAYVNGVRVGEDVLKPGFTHVEKTRRSFTYDVTALLKKEAGAENVLSAAVSSGWWRDKIVNWHGKRSAFRGVLELTYADGTKELVGTKAGAWLATDKGPVKNASIFEGEVYDARVADPMADPAAFDGKAADCVRNDEFKGEVLPSEGAEICLRRDLAMKPVEAYCWKGVEGANAETNEAKKVYGRVKKTTVFDQPGEVLFVKPGETLVIDFGQNCAAVPELTFKAAEGTTVTVLPAEMLNDANGERARGNDGPAGSAYRENLRMPETGMHAVYTFAKGDGYVTYRPTFTFFGYRYASVTATAEVEISGIVSIPVTSITKEMEIGSLETGDKDVNRLIANVYWGQLSNYLSVPTDCPQRNERLGWTADTQVFADAGAFNADTTRFFRKWMRDMRDTTNANGSFPGVAPFAQYGASDHDHMRTGWADAGIIAPWKIWRQFGDRRIVDENWAAMEKFALHTRTTKRAHEAVKAECNDYQWNDWLSLDKFESASSGRNPEYDAFCVKDGKWQKREGVTDYWSFLGACYWAIDMEMMKEMAAGTGRDAAKWAGYEKEAKDYLKATYFKTSDGTVRAPFADMQTPAVLALKLGLVEGAAKEKTIAFLKADLKRRGNVTGFLGCSWLMDTLAANGMEKLSVDLLLNHRFPSWLYSVDQGATTIWERWNGWTKDAGFGPVGMNSYNHYAYGQVLGWMYRRLAGIEPDSAAPGFRNIIMKPVPDRRLGHVTASYRSAAGLIRSAWRYEGAKWIWDFTVPEGATASVTLPGESAAKRYGAGTYHIER